MTTLVHAPTCAGGDELERQQARRPDGSTLVVTRCPACSALAAELVPAPAGYVQASPGRRPLREQLTIARPRPHRRR